MNTRILTLACLAAVLSAPAHAAGTVQVNFLQSDQYTDIGHNALDRERNLADIARHLQSLGVRLADGQTLRIDLHDIDLAGELRFSHRIRDVRVLKGGADWPRMKFQWTLSADDRVLQSGEEHLQDMGYLARTPRPAGNDALAYDLRLIDEWFARRFEVAAQ